LLLLLLLYNSSSILNDLQIRVAHYGELSPECVHAYYKYGCALLYKAQDEADPLGTVPKKDGDSQQESAKDGSVKNVINGESSTASVLGNVEEEGSTNHQEGAADDGQYLAHGMYSLIICLK
jgi:HAT1-interacting factor 1